MGPRAAGSRGPYAAAWADYARRRRVATALLVGGLPVLGLYAAGRWALAALGAPPAAYAVALRLYVLLVFAWVLLAIVASTLEGALRCPRCGRPFFRSAMANLPLARRCLHCRLPLWADGDSDGDAPPAA